ncbi:MAG: hypothetical protein ABI585_06380 [Betaproteobacteria bacterium]
MIFAPKRSDSIAEWTILVLVVMVLGFAATSAKLDPAPSPTLSVDQIAKQVRMQMPIGRDCLRAGDDGGLPCRSQFATAEGPR